jgi:hypothetical protein
VAYATGSLGLGRSGSRMMQFTMNENSLFAVLLRFAGG